MSDTTQDHAAAIRQEADRLYWMALIQEPDRDQLYRHADALAAENARLRKALDEMRYVYINGQPCSAEVRHNTVENILYTHGVAHLLTEPEDAP